MKLRMLLLPIVLLGFSTLFAQETNEYDVKYASAKPFDNVFVSIGVGGQSYLNDDNFSYGFGKSLHWTINASVGKYVNPIWGFRGQAGYSKAKLNSNILGAYKAAELGEDPTTMTSFEDPKYYTNYYHNYIYLQGDFMVNALNLFGAVNPNRAFDFFFYFGPGFNVGKFNPAVADAIEFSINGSAGLMAKYNINKEIAIDFDLRGVVTPTLFKVYAPEAMSPVRPIINAGNSAIDGHLYASLGATYTIGGMKMERYEAGAEELRRELNEQISAREEEKVAAQKEIKELEEALKVAESQNAAKSAQQARAIQQMEEELANAKADYKQYVGFTIDKSDVTREQLVVLQAVADYMKANPDVKMKVVGYADARTGNAAINLRTSDRRAKSVYNMLVKRFGVDADRLSWIGLGDQEQPFKTNAYNRMVMIYGEETK